MSETPPVTLLAEGLAFPEGPVAVPDGSVILVEIAAGRITRVMPDGRKLTVAEPGGGPNGAAIGPDGMLYICNNGGFEWTVDKGFTKPAGTPADWSGGRIERVDPETGKVEVLYTESDGRGLRGPNDIVFDDQGGFWFTDLGKTFHDRTDHGAIHYARADGSLIRTAAWPVSNPNGIGLSPDGRTVYAAETTTGRLWAWTITGPGELAPQSWPEVEHPRLMGPAPGFRRYDSLAVEASGNICVASLRIGGIEVYAPDGPVIDFVPFDDPYTTNICFGGPGLKTAYVTLSGTGRLVSVPWPRAGLKLAYG